MNVKTDEERRGNVLRFRVTQDERQKVKRLSQATGLSISNLFRLTVLGTLTPMPEEFREEARKRNAEVEAILGRLDISGRRKRKLLREGQVKRIRAKVDEGEKHKRKSA